MRVGLVLDNCRIGEGPAGSSYDKLTAMGATAVGTLWTGGTRHGRAVYEECERRLDKPLYIVRVGGHRQTAAEWLADSWEVAEEAAGVVGIGRGVAVFGNEPNLEGWADDPEGYGRTYAEIRSLVKGPAPLFACPSVGVPGWADWLGDALEAAGDVRRAIVNLYAGNVGLVSEFGKTFPELYVGEVNNLELRGEERRRWLSGAFGTLARAGVVAALVFIAGGNAVGWDGGYIVESAEVAFLGAGAHGAGPESVPNAPVEDAALGSDPPAPARIPDSVTKYEGETMDVELWSRVARWAPVFGPFARGAGVRVSLVAGLIAVESGGDPAAKSAINGEELGRAQGLMQVLPGHFGVKTGKGGEVALAEGAWMRQPGNNVSVGVGYLRALLDRYGGRETSAVAGYFGAVDEDGNPTSAADVTGTPGTRYVELVMGAASEFGELDGVPWERLPWPDMDLPRDYCVYGETWPEVAANLKGVCDDALGTGREIASLAGDLVERWGAR